MHADQDHEVAQGPAQAHLCRLPLLQRGGERPGAHEAIKQVFAGLPQYRYSHLYIDNASTDGTVEILRELAKADPNVKVIVNARNFGHIRSPFHAMLQSDGDATVLMASDFQDPPSMIPEFLQRWEEGSKIIIGVKVESEEQPLMYALRSMYYGLAAKLADIELMQHVTGFGLYDQRVIEILRGDRRPSPLFPRPDRGHRPRLLQDPLSPAAAAAGITKNNFYSLYDIAMLGITNHSKVPLRVATIAGIHDVGGLLTPGRGLLHRQAALLELVHRGSGADLDQPLPVFLGTIVLYWDYW